VLSSFDIRQIGALQMRWQRGRRYGGIDDRRGMRTGGVAGGE
jgi:hypothetical protein